MSQVFPKDSRAIALRVLMALAVLAVMATLAVTYYVTPKYTRVGYEPVQPVAYSHELHVGRLGLDCLYCHTHVVEGASANIPTSQVCMNCHDQAKGNIRGQSGALLPLREAHQARQAVRWVKVHKLPDFVYFNHAVHVNRGVGCVRCHGRLDRMPAVYHDQPMSMSWCLDCHRDPGPDLRPAEEVTSMTWEAGSLQRPVVVEGLSPPVNCSGCHR